MSVSLCTSSSIYIYIYIYGYLFPFTLWTERITREDSTETHYPDSLSDTHADISIKDHIDI